MGIKVIVAKNIGFCFGVRRSVETVKNLLESENKVYVSGELIHNEKVLDELKKKGMIIFDPYSHLPNDLNSHVAIVRAHGLSPDLVEKLRISSKKLVDTTCPIVMNMFKTAVELSKNHDRIFVFGDPKHPEIKALKGYVNEILIYNDLNELENILDRIKPDQSENVAVISQTTKDYGTFKESVRILLNHFKNLTIRRTICDVTIEREREVQKLSECSDMILIIGSRRSSNTVKLLKLARERTQAILIADPKELTEMKNICDFKVVSILSGTSTPDYVVREIISELEKMCKEVEVKWNR